MRKRVAYHLGGHRSNRFHILVQQGLLHLVDQVDDAFVLRIGFLNTGFESRTPLLFFQQYKAESKCQAQAPVGRAL